MHVVSFIKFNEAALTFVWTLCEDRSIRMGLATALFWLRPSANGRFPPHNPPVNCDRCSVKISDVQLTRPTVWVRVELAARNYLLFHLKAGKHLQRLPINDPRRRGLE